MTDTVALPENVEVPANAERMAWGVLLIAFAVFCVICIVTTIGVHYFLFRSSVSMQTTLRVGNGTVRVKESTAAELAESGQRALPADTRVRTDSTNAESQATIKFTDPRRGNRLIAVVTLKNATSLRLRRAIRPRFGWSTTNYQIDLLELFGEVDVWIAEDDGRNVEVIMGTQQGAEIRLGTNGRYVVFASDTRVELTNRWGEAVLIAPDRANARAIPPDFKGIYSDATATITTAVAPVDLVTNGVLETREIGVEVVPDVPIDWACTYDPNPGDNPSLDPRELANQPQGRWMFATAPDGRESFRLVRGDGATANGATLCEQKLGAGPGGLDVTAFDDLSVQATVYIESHSVSECGRVGSECPLMMRVKFINASGGNDDWYHGVYARVDPNSNYRRRCDSCLDEHVQVYEDTWYIYESGDLFDIFPSERRPVAITDVIFYASGHDYDVYVDEVRLLGTPMTATDDPEDERAG